MSSKLIMPDTEMVFRANSMDFHTITQVMVANEYRLPPAFKKDDFILDIGANIGCFALMCLARGAGDVECWEADPSNFRLLCKNLKPKYTRKVALARAIVMDRERCVKFTENEFFTSGCRVDPATADRVPTCAHERKWTRGIDSIVPLEPFRLLKMDIEGAEWPIIYNSKNLVWAREILVECHPSIPYAGYDCTVEGAIKRFEDLNFRVEHWDEVISIPGAAHRPNVIIRAVNRRRMKNGTS